MSSKDAFSFIKEYWIIFAFIFQIIFNYAGYLSFKDTVTTDVVDVIKRIEVIETRSINDALKVSEINSRLASIETSLKFIERQFNNY